MSNRDEAINQLKAEADAAHKDFVECLERAKGMSKELDELFAHRDFLKGEGDRFHKEFLACREKADEVHTKITEMMKDCLLYTSPSPRDRTRSRMPSSA